MKIDAEGKKYGDLCHNGEADPNALRKIMLNGLELTDGVEKMLEVLKWTESVINEYDNTLSTVIKRCGAMAPWAKFAMEWVEWEREGWI